MFLFGSVAVSVVADLFHSEIPVFITASCSIIPVFGQRFRRILHDRVLLSNRSSSTQSSFGMFLLIRLKEKTLISDKLNILMFAHI